MLGRLFLSSRRRHTRSYGDWTSDVCSSDLLAVVTWSYPRGEGITDKKGETAVDVAAYAAQIACQLGSHVVKVKPPGEFIYQPEAQKVFEKYSIPWKTLADRTRHVMQSCF